MVSEGPIISTIPSTTQPPIINQMVPQQTPQTLITTSHTILNPPPLPPKPSMTNQYSITLQKNQQAYQKELQQFQNQQAT